MKGPSRRIRWSAADKAKARRVMHKWDKTDLEEVLSGIPNNELERAQREDLVRVEPTNWGHLVWDEMEREDEVRDARIRRRMGRM